MLSGRRRDDDDTDSRHTSATQLELAFLWFSFAAAAVVVLEDDSSFNMIPVVPISSRYGWILSYGRRQPYATLKMRNRSCR